MDIQKEKEAFEQEFQKTSFYKNMIKSLENSDCPFTSVFEMRNGKYRSSYIQLSFEMWQAAKAQAVPEWIDISDRLPNEGQEVFVHHFGQIKQATKDKTTMVGLNQETVMAGNVLADLFPIGCQKSIKLPESFHFYYEHDAKVAEEKAMIEAQEQVG